MRLCRGCQAASRGGFPRYLLVVATFAAGLSMFGPRARPLGAAQVPGESPPAAGLSDRDLITRYRFSERYGKEAEIDENGALGQFRVGIQETIRDDPGQVEGTKAGRPEMTKAGRPEGTKAGRPEAPRGDKLPSNYQQRQIVYVERAAEVSSLGQVKSLVRRYEKARLNSDPTGAKPGGAHTIEGMTIWFRHQPDDRAQIISLDEGRELRDSDYKFAALQWFVPGLTVLLPSSPVRIGDTWPISRLGVGVLVEGGYKITHGGLTGKLVEVRRDPKGSDRDRIAVIEITGRLQVVRGADPMQMGVRAQIEFAFAIPRPPESSPVETKEDATVDASGGIVRLSMASSGTTTTTTAALGASGTERIVRNFKKEVVLERQLADTGAALEIPRDAKGTFIPPVPTPENSWLTYIDPQGRFRFRHPQELYRPQDVGIARPTDPNKLELIHIRPGGGADRVTVEVLPKAQRKPDEVLQALLADWKKHELEVLQGGAGWLPEGDWPGMRAYRIEDALMIKGRSTRGLTRIHFDGYVIHFSRAPEASVVVEATTVQDPPTQFRRDVEGMLKTFQWNPSAGS
jgi:hypothetical protein